MYLVVNIGCIECGVSSNIVGLYDNEEVAKKIAANLSKTHDWRENGQNFYETFPLPKLNKTADEYLQTQES